MLVRIEGECTVERSDEIKAKLLEALEQGGDLELDLSAVSSMDMSFCQILHAVRQSCQSKGVNLSFSGLPKEQATQAVFCGLPGLAGLNDAKPHEVAEACQ